MRAKVILMKKKIFELNKTLSLKKILLEKKNKKLCIGTKYSPLSANCSSLDMKNYHPGLLINIDACPKKPKSSSLL